MNKYKHLNKKAGVYCIKNTVDNRIYIGSSVNILSRIKDHLKRLKGNYHANKFLQVHFKEHGSCFYFEVLMFCHKKDLIKEEQLMLDNYKSYEKHFGFNIAKTAGSMIGFKHTDETKKSWSKKRSGVKLTFEAKESMSKAKLGSKHPRSKLTEIDVVNIRNSFDNKRDYSRITAKKYNVSWHTINYILKRKTWKHI
jgi:group I intron endonuclease